MNNNDDKTVERLVDKLARLDSTTKAMNGTIFDTKQASVPSGSTLHETAKDAMLEIENPEFWQFRTEIEDMVKRIFES